MWVGKHPLCTKPCLIALYYTFLLFLYIQTTGDYLGDWHSLSYSLLKIIAPFPRWDISSWFHWIIQSFFSNFFHPWLCFHLGADAISAVIWFLPAWIPKLCLFPPFSLSQSLAHRLSANGLILESLILEGYIHKLKSIL